MGRYSSQALLFDGVDEHDTATAEVTQLPESRNGRADRRVGVRRLADRKPGLPFGLSVDRISERPRHELELADEPQHRAGLRVERLRVHRHDDYAVTLSVLRPLESHEVDA